MTSIYQSCKLKLFMQITCFTMALVSCGKTNDSSQSAQTPTQLTSPLSIANTGIVPILGGTASSSVVYVHNNGNEAIYGIQYTAKDSNTSVAKATDLKHITLNDSSTQNCSVINPGQSCPIAFTTAAPSSKDFAGSIVITLAYTLNSEQKEFSQLVNYAQVTDQTERGVVINSGVNIIASSGVPGYGVVYAYGSNHDQIYDIVSQSLDKSGFTITQGKIIGTQMSSNAIQAIEIQAPIISDGTLDTIVNLTVNSRNINVVGASYTSSVNSSLALSPISDGALLMMGNSPVINTSIGTAGTLNVYNAGNSPTTLGSATAEAGISITADDCAGSLASHAACSVAFKITSVAISGNGDITIPYTPGIAASVSSSISWYTTGGPLLGITANPSPIMFNASESQNAIITVTNLGAVPISDLSVPNPSVVSGTGTANIIANTCASATLATGGESCSYVVNMSAAAATSGSVNFGISGNYLGDDSVSQSYGRNLNASYTAAPYAALLNVTAPAFNILGDGIATQTQTIIINNIGSAPAQLGTDSLTNTTGYTTKLSGTGCESSIQPGASCTTRDVDFGPVTNSTGSTITVAGTGDTFAYKIPYTGGTQTESVATAPLNATVGLNADLTISEFGATFSSFGTGLESSPYVFSGASPTGQIVTVTYKNSGSTPIQITGISNSNSGFQWAIDTANSTCYTGGIPSKTIAANATCTVIFKNVISSNFMGLGNIGATYTMNLLLPSVTYVTNPGGVQYQQTPTTPSSAASIYATSTQATLVSTISESAGTMTESGTVSIVNTITNATGYGSIVVTSTMEDYFTGTPTMTNCTQSASTSGIRTQVCTLTTNASVGTGVYSLVNYLPVSTSLHVNFALTSTTPSGAVVSFSPVYSAFTLK